MPAPKGNRNASKGSKWRNALETALENYAQGVTKGYALNRIAEVVVEQALAGDRDAIREIADRLDGKPQQSMSIEHTHRDLTDAELESRLAELLGKAGTVDPARGEAQTIQ